MKQCQQCGVLAEEGQTACPNCRASIVGAPPIPEPPKKRFGCVPVFFGSLVVSSLVLALIFRSVHVLFVAAAFSFGLTCAAMLFMWRPPPGDSAQEATSVYVLCVIGILLATLATLFGGCALMFP